MYPAIVIEIKRVDMNKPVDILNKNIESISLFDMKGLGMVLPRWSIAILLLYAFGEINCLIWFDFDLSYKYIKWNQLVFC